MENDSDRIKLMNSLLLSMPGSPIIYYGDEIGMGDNIYVGDRNGVRTPMQWSPDRNAGFSRADPQRLFLPPIMDAVYGYQAVTWKRRRATPPRCSTGCAACWPCGVRPSVRTRPIDLSQAGQPQGTRLYSRNRGRGDPMRRQCLAHREPVELDLKRFRGRVPVEMLGRTAFPPIGELPYLLTLSAYGFYWFRLATATSIYPSGMRTRSLPTISRCLCCSMAGPAFSATGWCDGESPWHRKCGNSSRAKRSALPRIAALVRRQERAVPAPQLFFRLRALADAHGHLAGRSVQRRQAPRKPRLPFSR